MTQPLKILFLTLIVCQAALAQRGADGKTFSARKAQYLDSLPAGASAMGALPDEEKRLYLFGWLEKGIYNDVVSETIRHIMNDRWLIGARAHQGYMIVIPLRYGPTRGNSLISQADEDLILNRLGQSVDKGEFFGNLNPNKNMWALVGVYLYSHFYDRNAEIQPYGYSDGTSSNSVLRRNWPDFSFNGHSYEHGSSRRYNAEQFAKDMLEFRFQDWYVEGNREFDGLNYMSHFTLAALVLYSEGPDNVLTKKAKMAAELSMLDAVLDFGNSEWGGTLGRTDFKRTELNAIYPFHEYWGLSVPNESRPETKLPYALNYSPPGAIVAAGVISDEPDDYFHWHMENHDATLKHDSDKGKWNFVTKNYNIGGNLGQANQGWQVTVKGSAPHKFIRFWINDQASDPPDKDEQGYLGKNGRQFRNAIFAKVNTKPHLHERKSAMNWDAEERSGGWVFKRSGKAFVAIGLGPGSASVEMATEGVEYQTWADFKSAVRSRAVLESDFYQTSTGARIGQNDYSGLNRVNDRSFPFKRMETIDYQGRQIIRWDRGVMTLTKNGQSLVYDFNNWNQSATDADVTPPSAPRGVKISTQD